VFGARPRGKIGSALSDQLERQIWPEPMDLRQVDPEHRIQSIARGEVRSIGLLRRLRAKPDKKICRLSGCDAEFVKDALHGVSQVMVVAIDGSWVLCTVGWRDFLRGRK
jgi:hypothetical protein